MRSSGHARDSQIIGPHGYLACRELSHESTEYTIQLTASRPPRSDLRSMRASGPGPHHRVACATCRWRGAPNPTRRCCPLRNGPCHGCASSMHDALLDGAVGGVRALSRTQAVDTFAKTGRVVPITRSRQSRPGPGPHQRMHVTAQRGEGGGGNRTRGEYGASD